MPQIHVAIVENEREFIRQLKGLIMSWGDEMGSGVELHFQEFHTGEDMVDAAETGFHIIFMDIQLDGTLDGFETAKQLREKGVTSKIAFLTSYDSYVHQGYEVEAIAYMRKPIKDTDIRARMNRILSDVEGSCFFYHGAKKKKQIPYQDILFFQSSGHYIEVVTCHERYAQKGKLDIIIQQLPTYFVRCHRVNIVNVRWIEKIRKNEILMKNDEILGISAPYKEDVSRVFMRENY